NSRQIAPRRWNWVRMENIPCRNLESRSSENIKSRNAETKRQRLGVRHRCAALRTQDDFERKRQSTGALQNLAEFPPEFFEFDNWKGPFQILAWLLSIPLCCRWARKLLILRCRIPQEKAFRSKTFKARRPCWWCSCAIIVPT